MRSSLPKNIADPALAFFICLFLALIACGHKSPETKRPVAVKGVLDLRGWNFERDGSVNLDGEWEFYWDRLLEPSDFAKTGMKKIEVI